MIRGQRVTLRALQDGDVEVLRQWRNHPALFPYHFSDLPLAQIEQRRWYEHYSSGGSTIVWIIENEEGTPIGYTLIKNLDHKNRQAEIGLHLDPDFQSRGYGKDAFLTLMRFGFHELNLHRLYLEVFDFNEKAVHMYESLGFVTEGRRRETYFTQNAFHDVIQMSMLDHEFAAQYPD